MRKKSTRVIDDSHCHYNITREIQRKLANDISNVTQLLYAIKLDMQWLNLQWLKYKLPGLTQPSFQQMMETINLAVKNTDEVERKLWPKILDHIGLIPALEHQLDLLQKSCRHHAFLFYPDKNIKSITLTDHQNMNIFITFQTLLFYLSHEIKNQSTVYEISMSCQAGNIIIEIFDRHNSTAFTDTNLIKIKQHIKEPEDCSIRINQQHLFLEFNI